MIYFIQAEGVGYIKIGFTDGEDAQVRLATLQTGSPVALRLLGTAMGTQEDEKNLHRRFAAHRVQGEWFKPVAELLALISPAEVKSCNGVEIAERSVTIRVLTVGRKQFTKSLLEQIPHVQFIDWKSALRWIRDSHQDFGEPTTRRFFAGGEESPPLHKKPSLLDYAGDFDISGSPFIFTGPAWGWIAGGWEGIYDCREEFRWIIFDDGGRLCKQKDYLRASGNDFSSSDLDLLRRIYHTRLAVPGFRDEDQLFIGA